MIPPDCRGFGPRITQQEFQERVVSLHLRTPSPGDAWIRREELEARIDLCFGQHFPPHRRTRLWRACEAIERERLRLALWALACSFLPGFRQNWDLRLTSYVRKRLGNTLSPQELAWFLMEEP